MSATTLKKIPAFHTDEEAEHFVATADLSEYDLSGGRPLSEILAERTAAIRRPGRPKLDNAKEVVTLRLDPQTIDRYKAAGGDWRARMRDVLERGP